MPINIVLNAMMLIIHRTLAKDFFRRATISWRCGNFPDFPAMSKSLISRMMLREGMNPTAISPILEITKSKTPLNREVSALLVPLKPYATETGHPSLLITHLKRNQAWLMYRIARVNDRSKLMRAVLLDARVFRSTKRRMIDTREIMMAVMIF